ncbi:hypothetical protein BS50DRAFT_212645 [Corynespora cassiicola Philippines]|uniref:Arrestin-like N-terminal domain-containing protein n=1 Tax=Corynespora cassiicola Philippines TaxID=1448308 RepID=A0A2T2N470_CORCC|nr:hypothetical protein BS50DRAFT_212645 [Corynespora cassiicola Philippines]
MAAGANNPYDPIFIDVPCQPSPYYTSGDIIKGKVCIDPTKRPNTVSITFKGRCKVSIRVWDGTTTGKVHKERVELFKKTLQLFTRSQTKSGYGIVEGGVGSDNKVRLPFQFTFPTVVENQPKWQFSPREDFEHKSGHVLPPSFRYNANTSIWDLEEQLVEYSLEAELYASDESVPDNTSRLCLQFRPQALETDADRLLKTPKMFKGQAYVRTGDLIPGYDESLKDKVLQVFSEKRNTKPWIRWRVDARVPHTLVSGTAINGTLSFNLAEHSESLVEIPPVFLRRIRITLTAKYLVRISCVPSMNGSPNELAERYSPERCLLDESFPEKSSLLYDGLSLSDIGSVQVPDDAVPDFKSFGFRVEHELEILLWAKCVGKEFKVTACRGDVQVVSHLSRPVNQSVHEPPNLYKGLPSPPPPPKDPPPPPSRHDLAPPPYAPPPYSN